MGNSKDSWLDKWRRFRRRSPEDRSFILLAAVLLPVTGIGLRLFGFQRLKELVEQLILSAQPPKRIPAAQQPELAARAVRAVRSAEIHGVAEPNCLERSITLWWLLRLTGVEGELHIGARKENGKFHAHAWVEWRGKVLNDSEDVHLRYSRFDAPIAATDLQQRAPTKVGFQ